MIGKDILSLETRRRIYHYVLENPGVHFRDISRNLQLKVYNLKYHLSFLEKQGLIITKNENGYVRCFVAHSISNGDKKLLCFLRQEPTRNILLSLQWCLGLTLSELSEFLEKSPSAISFHLKKLIENEIVVPAPIKDGVIYRHNRNNMFDRRIVGREIIYTLKDPFAVYRAFTIYKKSILNKTTMEIFETVYSSTSKFKRYRPINYSIDTFFEDLLFDVFPHPYHA